MPTKIKNLPCPFCGSIPKFKQHKASLPEVEKPFWSIECSKKSCLISAVAFGDTKGEAATQWNNRIPNITADHRKI